MNKTLLEQAKQYKTTGERGDITSEIIELAVAWAKGDISMTQVSKAVGKKNPYALLARALSLYIKTSK